MELVSYQPKLKLTFFLALIERFAMNRKTKSEQIIGNERVRGGQKDNNVSKVEIFTPILPVIYISFFHLISISMLNSAFL